MNKFQRILWTVNGILIFGTFILIAFFLIDELAGSWFNSYSPPQVIIGEELERAKEEGLVLQGLEYDAPLPIHGSTGYLLPVSLKTYDTPRQDKDEKAVFSYSSKISSADYYYVADILFLNANFQVTRTLLNKKAFITSFRYPTNDYNEYGEIEISDTTLRHITYLIGFEDSSKDGLLNDADNNDLFISDLNGDNLVQVTKGIDIATYSFLDRNKILIQYYKRENQLQEHKRKYFALYQINERKLEELNNLHQSLNDLEKILTK